MYLKSGLHLVLITGALWGQQALTIEDAVAKVAGQNRQVLQARATIGIRLAEAKVQRTRRWPVLSSQIQAGPLLSRAEATFPRDVFGEEVRVGIPRTISGFSTSQVAMPLIGQGRIGLAIRSADLEAKAASAAAEVTEQRAVGQVRSLYFQVLALQASRATLEAQVTAAQEILRLAQKGVTEGVALAVEASEAEARLERARADRTQIETEIENGYEQLNVWMGTGIEERFQLVSVMPAVTVTDLDAVVAQAVAQRPELTEARLRLEQTGVAMRAKQWEWLPDLDASLTHYGFLNAGSFFPKQVLLAGVTLRWEPWDWGRKKQEQVALGQRKEQARLGIEQLSLEVRAEARRAWREWERTQRELLVASREKSSYGESLRIAKQRYESQVALLRSVLEAQTNWEAAGQREARAMAAAGAAWANLQLAMGAN